jgi:DNA-binding transcriptional regulator YdaS (Cro superfamily)
MRKRIPPLYLHLEARNIPPTQLAKLLGVNKSTITRWSQSKVPAERVREVAALTGIPASALRPDLFAPSAEAAA